MKRAAWCVMTIAAALCAGCSSTPESGGRDAPATAQASPAVRGYKVGKPYQIKGIWYYPKVDYEYSEIGVASWYGPGFHGKQTANGELYDMNELTAAHRTLPMPSMVQVTNLENGRSLKLRVNDRGPFVGDRIIDVSRRGAQLLGFHGAGTAQVKVEIIEDESRMLAAGYDVPVDQPAGQAVAGREIGQVPAALEEQAAYAPAAAEPQPVYAVYEQPVTPQPAADYAPGSYGAAAPSYASPPSYAADADASHAGASTPYAEMAAIDAAPRGASGYYVQAGAFSDAIRADRVRQRLEAIGPTRVMPSWVNGRELLRVRLGPFQSDADLERALNGTSRAGFPDARVVAD